MYDERLPLYSQIESWIRRRILRGQLVPGEKLPKEGDLATQFGVSIITVRTALANLASQGLLIKKRAKGNFVAEKIPRRKPVIFASNLQEFVRHMNDNYKVKPLRMEKKRICETRIAMELQEFFGLASDDKIVELKRTRSLSKNPDMFVENFIRQDVAEHLTLRELRTRTVYGILKEKIGIEVGKTEAYLESVSADPDVAKILRCHVLSPLFLLQAYLWLPSREPFQMVNIFSLPDYVKYKLDIGS